MKKSSVQVFSLVLFLNIIVFFPGCKEAENPIKFLTGTFPDSVYNLTGINSQYDDYNSTIYVLGNTFPIIFSSNRGSLGNQFDLVQGSFWFQFDQTNGAFSLGSSITTDPFFAALITAANTPGNDYGPLGYFSSTDGNDYLMVASQNNGGPLDLYYLKYLPPYNNIIPVIHGPFPIKAFNTAQNEAYISFDTNEDSAYFSSDRNVNYDIFLHKRPAGTMLNEWFDQVFAASTLVDSINSGFDERCPFVFKNVMLFASDRPRSDGLTYGYDIYYSVFKNGKWNSPVIFGSDINTSADEFRPIFGYDQDFTNYFMVFSSNRLSGAGGFDLYFTGLTIPK
jgi:hypothetical protein